MAQIAQRALARASNVQLGAGPTTATLDGQEVASRLDALGSQRLFLVLRGLHASQPPGVLYHLYLALPKGAKPADDDRRHIGIINFYAAPTGDGADAERIFYSFDVTDAARALRERNLFQDPVTVTFVPAGSPEPMAAAAVSRIELVESAASPPTAAPR